MPLLRPMRSPPGAAGHQQSFSKVARLSTVVEGDGDSLCQDGARQIVIVVHCLSLNIPWMPDGDGGQFSDVRFSGARFGGAR